MLKTSLRSAAQPTDSTRRGWRAKKAAAKADAQMLFVVLLKKKNSKKDTANVQEQTHQVMTGRVCSEQVPVQHMRDPDKGMPVPQI
jgi:hypothetical protein